MREVRWERMFPHELEEAFAACPAAWFAYGLCEPHGPQNVLGLDGLKAHGLLVRAAREHGTGGDPAAAPRGVGTRSVPRACGPSGTSSGSGTRW